MIGRYSDLSAYKEIFSSTDFIRAGAGTLLIPLALFLPEPMAFGRLGVADLLLLASVAINGLPIVWSALKGVAERQMNVDELVSIAIAACLFTGHYLEAAVVSAIMVIGALVEEAVSDSARTAIRELMEVTPDRAVVEKDGKEREVAAAALKKGDILIVRQGQAIAVDGIILEGRADLDESAVTGESLPVEKAETDSVYAGTVCTQGYLRVKARAVGKDATMGRIISMVQGAEQSRTGAARLVDRYASFFTPVILGAAFLTFLATHDITRAITVLIVGCPCSFLLAGPVTTVAAVGRAAKNGILVKGGNHMETLAKAKIFCFDKTGTITCGTPRVSGLHPAAGMNENDLLTLAGAVEHKSLHPLARAIVAAAKERGLDLPDADRIETRTGAGISGRVRGREISIETAMQGIGKGLTCVTVREAGKDVGMICLSDRPRKEAAAALDALRGLGIEKTVMISGDQEGPVARVADEVGLSAWHAGQTPEDKLARIREYQEENLVYVGDGINDAPALKLAGTGIAMGMRGADAALETADVVLAADDLSKLPFLVSLSRKMTRRIELNIWLSFGLNAAAVAMGAFGFLTPVMGAVFHNTGSILVVALAAGLRYGRVAQA